MAGLRHGQGGFSPSRPPYGWACRLGFPYGQRLGFLCFGGLRLARPRGVLLAPRLGAVPLPLLRRGRSLPRSCGHALGGGLRWLRRAFGRFPQAPGGLRPWVLGVPPASEIRRGLENYSASALVFALGLSKAVGLGASRVASSVHASGPQFPRGYCPRPPTGVRGERSRLRPRSFFSATRGGFLGLPRACRRAASVNGVLGGGRPQSPVSVRSAARRCLAAVARSTRLLRTPHVAARLGFQGEPFH